MYKTEVIDKDTVEKRIVTRLIVLWKKKRKKLFHDRIIIEERFKISLVVDVSGNSPDSKLV